MSKHQLFLLALLAGSIALFSFIAPKGWKPSGTAEDRYDIGLWKAGGYEGANCGFIRSNKKLYEQGDYGSLIQIVSSQRYLGKQVKLSGYMKTRSVAVWAGFFIRADKEESDKPVTFKSMQERHINGNTNWTKYEVLIDIPLDASRVVFGGIVHGAGIAWFDSVNVEIIGESAIPATYVMCDTSLPRAPVNLDFEQ
ncbi:MAG: hypothetical protein EBZ77_10575 [Chitinophagia bacterium]|nr:hypothetical protein [Chitinophagia bacterium]